MIRIWHAAIAVLVAIALVGQTVLTVDDHRSLLNLYSYFTIQSNILILVASVLIVVRPRRQSEWWGTLRLAGLVGISVTGIVYATVLAGTAEFVGRAWYYDKIFHYIVPAMAVLGFFLFTPRTRFAKTDFVFIVWPIFWLGYTLLRAGIGTPNYQLGKGKYSYVPYEFLDIQRHGAASVLIASLVVTVLALGLAWLYWKFSNRDERAVEADA